MDTQKEVELLVRKYCDIIASNIWLCLDNREMC